MRCTLPNHNNTARVAALYDIHGNLPALEAVMTDVQRAEVEEIVIGGDVLPGPMPTETLRYLRASSIPTKFLFGNGEVAVLEQMSGENPHAVPEQHRPIIAWTARRLTVEDERFLKSWPKTLEIEVSGLGKVLFCHATPRDENECFTRRTSEDRLRKVFAGIDADVVVCGHTHMQFERIVGKVRVVNAGSVGMPFGQSGADWLLIGPEVQLRHTDYDLQAAAEEIRATSYPQAQDFVEHSLVQPPAEAKMLEVFAHAESK